MEESPAAAFIEIMRHSTIGASWQVLTPNPAAAAALVEQLGLPPLLARILAARGILDHAAADRFLNPSLDDLHDPLLMRDMPQAVAVLRRALDAKRRIRICGDYDADGVTATALLVRALGALGAAVDYYIPHRVDEGYGLNIPAVESAARDGVKLLVTVDCGVSAVEPLRRARELGLEVIVTDHHDPPPELPPAVAILNPKRADCPYPFKDLAGAGVAYKFVSAISSQLGVRAGAERAFLDLVAIGTIADVVALTGENRLLAKHGLAAMDSTRKQGISALIRAANVPPPVNSYHVAFSIAPRLNAAGRLDHAQAAVTLLLTTEAREAQAIAQRVCALNAQRQQQELAILGAAEAMIQADADLDRDRLILLASPEWHPGVIGIVASRLVERYHRPVVLAAVADSMAKGSARSVPGFHICDALARCSALLADFGGHALAAGFSVSARNLETLRAQLLDQAAAALRSEDLVKRIQVDSWAELPELTLEAITGISAMAPFGVGNPRPLIALREVEVEGLSTCGAEGRHLRLSLRQRDAAIGAIMFGGGHLAARLTPGTVVDACAAPEIDEWNNKRSVRLKVQDLAVE